MFLMLVEDQNLPENFKLQEIAGHFTKLEYLYIRGKPTNEFINDFLLKLPSLKYFSIQAWRQSFDEIVEFFNQNLPHAVKKRELMIEDRPFSPFENIHYPSKLLISSPNAVFHDSIFNYDFETYLFVKKLCKNRNSYKPKYFAYHPKKDGQLFSKIVFESEFNKD